MDDRVVLVVDDDPEIVRLIEAIISGLAGVRPVAAGDGEEALELAYRKKPALILLDLRIPKVTGAIVARRLKADPTTHSIPIVAVSALSDGPRIAQQAGCDGWISKPFEVEELAYLVELFLQRAEAGPTKVEGS